MLRYITLPRGEIRCASWLKRCCTNMKRCVVRNVRSTLSPMSDATCQLKHIKSHSAGMAIHLSYSVSDHYGPVVARVGNGYDQAQLRSIKMADAEHGEYRLSRIVSTRHLVRRPYCAWRESWDRLIFWM